MHISKILKEAQDKRRRAELSDPNKNIIFSEDSSGNQSFETPNEVDFVDLQDTPSAYTGKAGQAPLVNSGETALAFEEVLKPTDFMEMVDDGTYEGIAIYDDPPTNSNMVALMGKKGTFNSVYKEDSHADFEPGGLEDVQANATGLELLGNGPVIEVVSTGHTTQATSSSWSHAYANPSEGDLIIVTVGHRGFTPPTVQYGGVNVTLLFQAGDDGVNFPYLGVFAITKENQPTPGASHNLTVTGINNSGATSFTKLKGVSREILADLSKIVTGNSYETSSYSISTNITPTKDNSFIFDAVVWRDRVTEPSLGANQTKHFWAIFQAPRSAGASYKWLGTAGATSMSWTGSGGNANRIRQIVIAIEPDDYEEHGNRIAVPQDLTTLSTDPGLEIAWTPTKPTNTDVTIETAVKGETSYTNENIGTGDGANDTFYLPAYPATRHSDLVISVDGTPTAEYTRDEKTITFNAGHIPGLGLAVTATYTGVTNPSETAEVQTLYLGGATGGTYDLGIVGNMATLNYNDSAATIETALEAIFGTDLVTVAVGSDFTITFSVRIRASSLTADFTSLTGATLPTLTETTPYSAGDWAAQTSGAAISNIPAGSLVGQHLWIRETLETTDSTKTPTLTEVEVSYGTDTYGIFTTGGTVNTL